MKTIKIDLQKNFSLDEPLSICLGFFDGLHRGHQSLILNARANAKYKVAVISFDFNSESIGFPNKSMRVLSTIEDREIILRKLGIDRFIILTNSDGLFTYSAEDFINKILKKLDVKEVFAGTDYHFGHHASGSIEDLKKYFDVHAVKLLDTSEGKISTSVIMKLLDDGNIEKANELLGYDYQIRGVVGYGRQVGNKIGFPTANLNVTANYVLPKNGVYKTICYVDGKPFFAVTNIGVHPTVGASSRVLVESYLLHYDENAYGKTMYVAFLSRLRDEQKFDSVDALKKQISIDLNSIK